MSTFHSVSSVSLMYRLVALELIVAAQAVDLRGGSEHIGEGPRIAHDFVRESVDVLTDETEWNVDIDELTLQVADGELARRVAASIGGRPSLSEHEPPGI